MLDWLMASPVWAMAAPQGAKGGGGEAAGGLGGLLAGPLPMLILMFVIFYFLLIRPQQKKAKQHREMLASLRKGDQVVTAGGIIGRITGLQDQIVILEIAPQVRVKVSRASITGVTSGAPAQDSGGKKK